MPLNFALVGQASPWVERSWTARDAMLYAVGVGSGQDPLDELEFTTENSLDVPQKVLPTFVATVMGAQVGSMGDFDPAMRVHGDYSVELHRPIPPEGHARTRTVCTGIWDKGSGALVETESVLEDAQTGELLATCRNGAFVRGEGGFGGSRGPSSSPSARSERPPDRRVTYQTRPEQALLYRLTGDRNPLHSDPRYAGRGGFERPILHGLCTYGFAGRALLHTLCGSDPERFVSMYGRFRAPTLPGDALTVSIWTGEGDADFEVCTPDGTVVLDRGRVSFR
jgi:acyl dehydratase